MTRIHIDCETTGLDPDMDVLLEFSWFNEETNSCHTFFNPEFRHPTFRKMAAGVLRDSAAGAVNKYLERFGDNLEGIPQTHPDFFSAALRTLAALQMGGDTLVGFNVAFDIAFLNNYGAQLTTHRTLDLTSFFTGVLSTTPEMGFDKPLGFRDVIALVNPEFLPRIYLPDHTSSGDVWSTYSLLREYRNHGTSIFAPSID